MLEAYSFEGVYEDHADLVFNLCLNYLRSTEDAEEITQDVFLKVHEKYESFEHRSSLKTWIYRITVNQCLDHLKARKRAKRSGILVRLFGGRDEDGKTSPEIPVFDHPGVKLEHKEALQALFRQIDTLPEKQRSAILLKSTEGLSQKEIATVLEISEKAVESLLSRARRTLKSLRPNEGNGA